MSFFTGSRSSPRLNRLAAAGIAAAAAFLGLSQLACSGVETKRNERLSAPMARELPEEHGIDSAKLASGIEDIRRSGLGIHSLIVIRDGAMISESYYEPYDGSIYHDQASVTKTFMSTLIGIAIDRGRIGLDAPLLSFFPDREIANRDARKERVTVRHLLCCASGLYGDPRDAERTAKEMRASPDWVQFALDRPSVAEPGERFAYSNLDMHLLSAILQEATGRTALEFARAELFAPLGIAEAHWPSDPQGYSHGWGDLSLRPADAAKIGQLFLSGGAWGSARIVSKSWVDQSTRAQMRTESWRAEDYGFGWWVSRKGAIPTYQAQGREGQQIIVAPGFDLVLAMTGGGFDIDEAIKRILPAISMPKKILPPNPAGVASLRAAEPLPGPAATSVPELPDIARSVSGRIYDFDANPLGIRSLCLSFVSDREAGLTIEFPAEPESRVSVVGLDGAYRPSRAGRPALARGAWLDADRFALDYDEGPGLNPFRIELSFSGSGLRLALSAPGSSEALEVEGEERPASVAR